MSVDIPVVTTYDDKGIKGAIAGLKQLKSAQLAGVVSTGALVNAARMAIQAANEDARSQRLLAQTLRNTTGATDFQIAAIEKNISALEFSSVTMDDKLRPALQYLLSATKNAATAQDLLTKALDIAAYSGRDVESVALALVKAYNGNIGALSRMGLSITEGTKVSKDFGQAMAEIEIYTKGAAAEAAKGADGGWKKLGVIYENLNEAVGAYINESLTPLLELTTKAGHAAQQANEDNGWLGKSFDAVKHAAATAAGPLAALIAQMVDGTKEAKNLGSAVEASAGKFRMFEESFNKAYDAQQAKKLADLKKKQEEAAKAAKRLADALRTDAENALAQAKDAVNAYVQSISDAISSNVSLADAVSESAQLAADKENSMTDALKRRKDAYDALNYARLTNDVDAYNKALGDVADSEKAVSDAAGMKTKSYTQAFQEQVTAAKEFAGNIKTLIQRGLQASGVSQLLNLGAVAGNAVAKDLLSGTAGITVGSLNADLSTIANAGTAAGMATPGFNALMGASIGGQGSYINITVNAGVGDKTAIAKEITSVLQEYGRSIGGLPIKVKG